MIIRSAILLALLGLSRMVTSEEASFAPPFSQEFAPQPATLPHQLVRPPPVLDKRGKWVDPRYAKHTQASIPLAEAQPVWRSPYAYGYFGARPSQHWSLHHGERGQYRQWTGR